MKLDHDRIAKALGASSHKKIGKMKSIFDTFKLAGEAWKRRQEKPCEIDECLVQKYFEEQEKLPESMRSKGAMISCPCKRCNPYTL